MVICKLATKQETINQDTSTLTNSYTHHAYTL